MNTKKASTTVNTTGNLISIEIGHNVLQCLADTGASISGVRLSIIKPMMAQGDVIMTPVDKHQSVYGVCGTSHAVLGMVNFPI
jgi:hypothetical protein